MSEPKPATIRDVAQACGVSIYTVSSVMNNKGDISEKTSRKVWKTIRRLNYDPTRNIPLAKHLSAKTIGLVLPDVFSESSPFFSRAINTARSLTSRENYDLKLFTDSGLTARLEQNNPVRTNLGCDSFLFFCPCFDWQASVEQLISCQIPVAVVRRQANIRGITMVMDDDHHGIYLAMEHLHRQHGHTKIAAITKDFAEASPRWNAYLDYLKENGLENNPEIQIEYASLDCSLEQKISELHKSGQMTALACFTDDLAIEAAKVILELGLRIPEDIALTGYNNDFSTRQFHPGITSVNIPVEEMVLAACQSLLNVTNTVDMASTTMKFDNSLTVRESCGCKIH